MLCNKQVKIFLLMGQSAWEGFEPLSFFNEGYKTLSPKDEGKHIVHTQNAVHAEKLQHLPSHQRLNVGHPDGFAHWLAGLVDADGTWHFMQNKKGSWDFSFKVGQSNYNYVQLAYLKKKLKCGSITAAGKNCSQYRIRDPTVLHYFQIPLFNTTEFMTDNKAYDYMKFKKALHIYRQWQQGKYSNKLRDEQLLSIKNESKDPNFRAPWKSNKNQIPNKGWILGFTEAEGSFYLVNKTPTRIVHGAGWIQNNEKEQLEQMRQCWNIKAKVKAHVGRKAWMLDTTAASAVETLICFFEKKMKGMKAVEVRKWARSYRKHRGSPGDFGCGAAKGNFEELKKLREELRKAKKFDHHSG